MRISKEMVLPLFILIFCAACNKSQPSEQKNRQVTTNDSKELFHIPFISKDSSKTPVLVLVLHGDAPFNNPSYQYLIAKRIAAQNKGLVAVGVLRPGYTDNEGNHSEGERGNATGDNYTPQVLESIVELTKKLKAEYNPSKIVLVGHSGGAAISANLIANYANLFTKALLISCPCDLDVWREHMKQLQPDNALWDQSVNSLSPIEQLDGINTASEITIVHGDSDEVVPITIAKKYEEALAANSKQVKFITLENKGHEIALNKRVFELVTKMLE